MHRSIGLIAAAITIASLAGCTSAGSTTATGAPSSEPSSVPSSATASAAAPAATRSAAAKAKSGRKPQKKHAPSVIDSCYARPPASGDIYVWYVVPGLQDSAQELGGEWTWNHTTHSCQNSVQMVIATAPQEPGNCTAVGYVADNPGYDPNATPARPLKEITAESGPAC